MDTKAAIIALLTVWGVGAGGGAAIAEETAAVEKERSNPLLNRVWVRQGDDPDLPGSMQIFLSDGTLVSDSCWETYRLSRWVQVSDTQISWDEDGMTIAADIVSLSESELVLNLRLGAEVLEQHFAVAAAPYVCPDMVKG